MILSVTVRACSPMRRRYLAFGLFVLAAAAAAQSQSSAPVSVEEIFKRPAYLDVQLSPDGKKLSAIVPLNGRHNLAIIDLAKRTTTVVTNFKVHDVYEYAWLSNERLLVSEANLHDASGEIYLKGRYAVNVDGSQLRSVPSFRVLRYLEDGGGEFIVEEAGRTRYSLDAYRFNPSSGTRKLLTFESPGDVRRFLADHKGEVRVATSVHERGRERAIYYRGEGDGKWRKLAQFVGLRQAWRPVGFDMDNKTLIIATDDADGKGALYRFDPEKNERGARLVDDPNVGEGGLIFDRVKGQLVGIHSASGADHWIDVEWRDLQKGVDAALPETRNRLGWPRGETDRVVVTARSDRQPPQFYLLDRKTRSMEFLVSSRSDVDARKMSPMREVTYKARDGLQIIAMLTVPLNAAGKPVPLVVDIHGGPFAPGHAWGFDPLAQFLAARGYAVLQPNFRGTTGFGRAFMEAGYKQWGAAMQDDIADGVKWAIDQGVADKDRVCLMGGSYGGYATLMGLVKEPGMFKCGVAYVAVTDLELMFDVSWSDFGRSREAENYMREAIGNPDKERDKFREVSPLYQAARVSAPVLLAYGNEDRRVPIVHGEKFRAALEKHDKPHEWVVYVGEAHGFSKDENRFDFYRRTETFLAKHLGAAK